jgi:DNA primase
MSTIPQAEIDRIKANFPIRSIVSRWIELDKNGRACCPFHQEKSPSFKVSEDGYYKCFGCGAGGDVISFVQTYKAVSFKEACEIITGHVIEPERKSFKDGRIIMLSDRMAEGPSEEKLKPTPKKSTGRFNALWEAKVNNFTDEHADSVAINRGLDARIFRWLRENKLIGLHNSTYVAFPVHDEAGNIVRCHVKDHNRNTWYYDPKGGGNSALIIGDPKLANTTFILESQWDAFAIMSALRHWENDANYAYIVTRGASSNTDVSTLIGKTSRIIAIAQNDPDDKKDKDGRTPAQKWLERVKASIPPECIFSYSQAPEGYEDPNDWIAKENPSMKDVTKQFTERFNAPENNQAKKPRRTLASFCVNHGDTIGMSWEQIDNLRPPFVVDGFGRRGELMLLAAGSKTRKSWLVQDLGFCVVTGTPWLAKEDVTGGFDTAQASVHVFDLELNESEMRFRFAKARGNRTTNIADQEQITEKFTHYSLEDVGKDEAFLLLEDLKSTVAPGDLVIVDCLYRLHPDGNEPKEIAEVFEKLKNFAKETKSLVVIVDHFRKAGADNAKDRIAGTFVKTASASTIVAIETNSEGVLAMSIDARTFHGNDKVHVRFNVDNYRFERVSDDYATPETLNESEKWLVDLWKSHDHNEPVSTSGATAKWGGGLKRQSADKRLKQLEKLRWLAPKSQGKGKTTFWHLTAKGQGIIKGATELVAPVAPLQCEF